jgi:predicted amidohydrolase YtcJ
VILKQIALCVVAITACGALAPRPAAVAPADLVLLGGRVLTVDERFSIVTALAIRGGRFVAIGSDVDIRPYIAPATRVIDAAGRTVVPGLIDTHVHALGVADEEARQPLRNVRTVGELQAWVREEASRRPPGDWLWTPRTFATRLREHRLPTRQELDAAAPRHPVVVDSAYAFSLNTAALRAAGITRDTSQPPGGAIVKDPAGEPNGLLRNPGDLLSGFQRRSTSGLPLDMIERVHRQYLAAGITSIVERGATLEGYEAYKRLHRSARLHVRSTVTIRIPRADDARAVEAFVTGLPFTFGEGDEWLKAGALKIVVDGGLLTGTSFLRQPYGPGARQLYAIDDPGDRGLLTLTPEQVARAVAVGHRHGWQMVAHVTGDAGVDVVLDAIEAAQRSGPPGGLRHTLLHAYFANAETADRAARLAVLIDTQPAWHYKDADALADALGVERLASFIGLQTWRRAGVDVAINTDHMFGLDGNTSMNPFNPFLTFYSATTRKTESGRVVGAREAVSRREALRMMTSAAARFSFDERDRGSIEVGKLGDLVVLDQDFLAVTDERLRSLQADLTIVGGRVVFERRAP